MEYIKKIDDKTINNGNYYISKKTLIDLLKNEYDTSIISNTFVNFVDNGNNTIHFNGEIIKYFNYNNQIYFKAKKLAKILDILIQNNLL